MFICVYLRLSAVPFLMNPGSWIPYSSSENRELISDHSPLTTFSLASVNFGGKIYYSDLVAGHGGWHFWERYRSLGIKNWQLGLDRKQLVCYIAVFDVADRL